MANDLLLLGAGLAGVHPSLTLGNGLTAHWKLDEASGTRNDSVGSLHLTDNNTVTQATGKLGNCAQFVAANSEYLSVPSSPPVTMSGNTPYTLAAWVYVDAFAGVTPAIITKYGSAGNFEYRLDMTTAGVVRFIASPDGTALVSAVGSPSLVVTTWYYLLAWYDGNTINLQINDGAVVSSLFGANHFASTANFVIGARPPTADTYWNGRIDSVSVWKRALTSAERTYLYNSGSGREYPF